MRHFCRSIAFLLIALPAAPATAQDAIAPDTRAITAVPLPDGSAITIDGALDEPAWSLASVASGFLQRDPDNGAPATEATEVRILYDRSRLLIGVTLHDSEPGRLLGNQMQRDQSFQADDRFMWTIDTFLDGRSGYYFEINPAGAMGDGLIDPSETDDDLGVDVNKSWDGIWIARVRRGATGWTAEIEIPFGTVNFDPQSTTWGINFQRTVRRKNEESLWTGYARNLGLARMSSAGRVHGFSGLSQGLGLDLKPYIVGSLAAAPGRGTPGAAADGNVGLDLFYNLTPALRANVSLNTDFAETEVDERQVNLTRFPLFFQEKRDFFLQGSSYFDFARELGQQVTPFFSRRIGLDDRGQPQRIDVGAKLTGQIGAFDIGVLQVRTADTSSQAGSDFTVGRVRRRILQQSYVGGLYTRRSDRLAGVDDRHSVGADFALASSTFLGNKAIDWSAFYIFTSQPGASGDGAASGSRLQFPNDPFYFDMSYREIESGYAPAVGFLQRSGFRRYNPQAGYTWRFRDLPWVRSLNSEVDVEFYNDLENRLLSRQLALRPLTLEFDDGTEVAVEITPEYERLDEDFEISDGVILPFGGEYRHTRYQLSAESADQYIVSAEAEITWGKFFSGERTEYSMAFGIRPRRGVALAFEVEHNVLTLAEGSFDTTVYRVNANTQFSPWLSLANNLQYDTVSGRFGWQGRFRWIQKPGNDLFLVYTHNWQETGGGPGERRFATLDNRLATKLVYTLRF